VGYGIATAIFNSVAENPATSGFYANNPAEPYAAVFWFAAGISALGVLLVPWLKIGTQGGKQKEQTMDVADEVVQDNKGKEKEGDMLV